MGQIVSMLFWEKNLTFPHDSMVSEQVAACTETLCELLDCVFVEFLKIADTDD